MPLRRWPWSVTELMTRAAMKAATIGIAMGSGTDVALETADAALTHNRLTGLAQMIAGPRHPPIFGRTLRLRLA